MLNLRLWCLIMAASIIGTTLYGAVTWQEGELAQWRMENYTRTEFCKNGLFGVTDYEPGVKTPFIHSPVLSLPAQEYNLLEIKLKSGRSDVGRLYFASSGQPLTEAAYIDFFTPGGDDTWHLLRIPLRHQLWTGCIERVRLDLLFVDGVEVAISSIRFLKSPLEPGELLRNTDWQLRDMNQSVESWQFDPDSTENDTVFQLTAPGEVTVSGRGRFRIQPESIYPDDIPPDGYFQVRCRALSNREADLWLHWEVFDVLTRKIDHGSVKWRVDADVESHEYRQEISLPEQTYCVKMYWNFSPQENGETVLSGFSLQKVRANEETWSGEWIQPIPPDQVPEEMFFRYSFVLPEKPCEGKLYLTVDNAVEEIYLNGKAIPPGENAGIYNLSDKCDITDQLRSGRNCIAIKGINWDGPGGLLADLDIRLDNGTTILFGSSVEWRAAATAPPGWEKETFDDTGWDHVASLGSSRQTIWGNIAKQRKRNPSFPANRLVDANAAEASLKIFSSGALQMIQHGYSGELLHHWTGGIGTLTEEKIGFCRDNDIHWYFGTMTSGWGEDYTGTDQFCERLLELDPNARINLLVAVDQRHDPTQKDWAEAHPEIWARDETGKSRFNIHGTLNTTVPSWASHVWLDEECRRLRGLTEHVQRSSYRDHVVGISPVSGLGFEWMYWGAFDTGGGVSRMDYSPVFRAGFQQWVLAQYSSLADINRLYGTAYTSQEEIELPTVIERDSGDWFGLLDPKKSKRIIDFRYYISFVVSEAILRMARTVKESSNGKMLFGTFYGYVTYVTFPWWSETGHFALSRILESPDVDYLTCLTSYSGRRPGQEGGFMHPEGSFLLHGKTSFVQVDTRTHRVPSDSSEAVYGRCADVRESAAVLKREFANTLIAGCGYEFGYFGNGWIAEDRRLMQLVGRSREIELGSRDVNRLDPATSIAVIVDDISTYYTAQKASQHYRLVTLQLPAFAHTGCGIDTFLLSDLERLPDYKCYVFLNPLAMTPEQELFIRERLKRDGKVLVFIYAPGIIGKDGIQPERIAAVTGIPMEIRDEELPGQVTIAEEYQKQFGTQYGNTMPLGPVFVPTEGDVIGRNETTGLAALVRKHFDDYTVYYSSVPELSFEVLRSIAKEAGINIANPNGADATYASDKLLGIHSAEGGKRTLQAPPQYRTKATELFSGCEYPIVNGCFEVELEPMSTVLFRME